MERRKSYLIFSFIQLCLLISAYAFAYMIRRKNIMTIQVISLSKLIENKIPITKSKYILAIFLVLLSSLYLYDLLKNFKFAKARLDKFIFVIFGSFLSSYLVFYNREMVRNYYITVLLLILFLLIQLGKIAFTKKRIEE